MKKLFVYFVFAICLSFSLFASSDSVVQKTEKACPLIGTPACPMYPSCCE